MVYPFQLFALMPLTKKISNYLLSIRASSHLNCSQNAINMTKMSGFYKLSAGHLFSNYSSSASFEMLKAYQHGTKYQAWILMDLQ
jgi:hypothetical protein